MWTCKTRSGNGVQWLPNALSTEVKLTETVNSANISNVSYHSAEFSQISPQNLWEQIVKPPLILGWHHNEEEGTCREKYNAIFTQSSFRQMRLSWDPSVFANTACAHYDYEIMSLLFLCHSVIWARVGGIGLSLAGTSPVELRKTGERTHTQLLRLPDFCSKPSQSGCGALYCLEVCGGTKRNKPCYGCGWSGCSAER